MDATRPAQDMSSQNSEASACMDMHSWAKPVAPPVNHEHLQPLAHPRTYCQRETETLKLQFHPKVMRMHWSRLQACTNVAQTLQQVCKNFDGAILSRWEVSPKQRQLPNLHLHVARSICSNRPGHPNPKRPSLPSLRPCLCHSKGNISHRRTCQLFNIFISSFTCWSEPKRSSATSEALQP